MSKIPKHCYCRSDSCGVEVMSPLSVALISYCTAAAILAKPLFNAVGADVKNVSSLLSANSVSLTAIGLGIAIIFAGYVSAYEKHSNPLLCFVHACGVPGVLLGLLTVIQP